jgi:RHS repeat-associated protein
MPEPTCYTYDANGYLSTLKNGANTVTLFTNTGMNGFNQYTGYSLGNGKTSANSYYFGTPTRYLTSGVQDLNLSWNYQSGNLTSRYDATKGKTESFTYDNLNRLLSSSGTGLSTNNMTYEGNGNISDKTDVGLYIYGLSKINAVSFVFNTPGTLPLTAHSVTYTPYFQPAVITEGSYQMTLTYAADYERIKSVLTQNGATVNTRYYFGGYEKDISGGSTRHLHYINAGQGLVAIVIRENGTDTYNYVYTDHLGSILTVTNSGGTVIAEQNFDAWGRKRNTSTWGYTGVQSVPSWLYRGFTGHEHLPQFGLINMNGRLYDPLVGRMLSPDNNVQMPDFTQNYNRYSYALNNPLRFTDPDGEWIHIAVGAVLGGLVNGIRHADGKGGFWKGFAIGAVAGAVTAATGGAAVGALGLASTGVVSGLVSGATGAVLGSPIQGIGNAIVFGEQYSPGQWGRDIVTSGLIGGVTGGLGALIRNIWAPTNIFWGTSPASGRNIWSFLNKPKEIVEPGPLTGVSDELNNGKPFTYGRKNPNSYESLRARVQAKIDLYPKAIDPRTGRHINLPDVDTVVPENLRVSWSSADRQAFISEWGRLGYPAPKGGWGAYQIHHIIPRQYGGTNAFWNLIPLDPSLHRQFNSFWATIARKL